MPKQKKKKKGGTQDLCLLYLFHENSPRPNTLAPLWHPRTDPKEHWRINKDEADKYCLRRDRFKPTCRFGDAAQDGSGNDGVKGCWPPLRQLVYDSDGSLIDDDAVVRRQRSSSNGGGKRKTRKKRKKRTKRHRRRRKKKAKKSTRRRRKK